MARRMGRKTVDDSTQPPIRKEVNLNFDEALDLFLTDLTIKGLSRETKRWHRENLLALKKELEANGIDPKPSSITKKIVEKNFILAMIKRGLKVNTINGRIRSSRTFFAFLRKNGYISADPAREIRNMKREKPIIETFTKRQIKKLLSVIDRNTFSGIRDYVMFLIFLETGIRVSEACNIKVEDILFDEMVIRIKLGKGAKGRLVPFQNKLKAHLLKYLAERGEVPHPYLLITRDEQPMKKRTIQSRFSVHGEKAEITGVRCSPHTMRHTMAKFYILAGGDIFSLQKILGHASLDMVRHYVELFGAEVKEQHRKFSPLNDFE